MNCYNSSEHLREALQSVMAQTFTDFEIVFWDNCSTDESPAIANSFGERIRYFRGDHTVPLGAGRNLAIARARESISRFSTAMISGIQPSSGVRLRSLKPIRDWAS